MESIWRTAAITAIGPVAWGSTYVVTQAVLPADAPLWGATLRALPAALVLLAVARSLPRGSWIWKSAVLGVLNVGAFFWLLYESAQLLPSSVAATVMSGAPLVMLTFAWLLASERPHAHVVLGAVVGMSGVPLVVGAATDGLDPRGVAAALTGLVLSSLAFALAKRWGADRVTPLQSCAWQLLWGGGALLVVALAVEGAPPALDAGQVAAFGYVSIVATALANVVWFRGLERLQAGVVGIVGLLNPVTGVLLGVLVAGEALSLGQLAGMGVVALGILLGVRRRDQPACASTKRRSLASISSHAATTPS